MNLYLVVYEVDEGEPDWFHAVAEHLTQEQAEKLALEQIMDIRGMDTLKEAREFLGSLWVNTIDKVDGYKITAVKEAEPSSDNVINQFRNEGLNDQEIISICERVITYLKGMKKYGHENLPIPPKQETK